jgi:hypothetical protein
MPKRQGTAAVQNLTEFGRARDGAAASWSAALPCRFSIDDCLCASALNSMLLFSFCTSIFASVFSVALWFICKLRTQRRVADLARVLHLVLQRGAVHALGIGGPGGFFVAAVKHEAEAVQHQIRFDFLLHFGHERVLDRTRIARGLERDARRD